MSGGHFDYAQYQMMGHADEIERLLEDHPEFNEVTVAKFKECARTVRLAAAMLGRVDYLICGDDSEESFHRRWNQEVVVL